MGGRTFWSVLGSNLKCAVCQNKKCRLRYFPGRKKVYLYDGYKYTDRCQKDVEKSYKKALKRKLP